jgi:hypothetical protein
MLQNAPIPAPKLRALSALATGADGASPDGLTSRFLPDLTAQDQTQATVDQMQIEGPHSTFPAEFTQPLAPTGQLQRGSSAAAAEMLQAWARDLGLAAHSAVMSASCIAGGGAWPRERAIWWSWSASMGSSKQARACGGGVGDDPGRPHRPGHPPPG